MAIGYEKARNLMRQLDWKMRVSTVGDNVDKIVLFHTSQRREHTVILDSGRKLMRECVLSMRFDSHTAILEYNRVEAELESPRWFAVTRWCAEDVMAVAEERGITITEEQATAWWERNESRFVDLITGRGNEILFNMDFEEGE
jgi:hypothetical protein